MECMTWHSTEEDTEIFLSTRRDGENKCDIRLEMAEKCSCICRPAIRNEGEGLPEAEANTTLKTMEKSGVAEVKEPLQKQ